MFPEAKDIISQLNKVEDNIVKSSSDFDGYLVNISGLRGVALEISEDITFDESFFKVGLKTCKLRVDNFGIKNVLFLSTTADPLFIQFGTLCVDFIFKEDRNELLNNPYSWYEKWKNLLGNAVKNKIVYDVIGEMRTLLELQKAGKKPFWDSMNCGTLDISTPDTYYEVKSSVLKSSAVITIHNQYQLDYKSLDHPLFIAYCKVEQLQGGDSIESLYKQLIAAGYNQDELDYYLDYIGYAKGRPEREKEFVVHEIRLYEVNDSFPKITKEDFKEDQIPCGITKFQYDVTLDNLPFEQLV